MQRMYQEVFKLLLGLGHVNVGDLVLVTKGELSGIAGRTNSMQILSVTSP
jgi:pyruvate kinase